MSPSRLHIELPIELKLPSNICTVVRWDQERNLYIFENRIGNEVVSAPFIMTPDEYMQYRSRQLQINYFRQRNSLLIGDEFQQPERYRLPNRQKSRDPIEMIFGSGGVRLTGSGYLELSAGISQNRTDNPALPEQARRRTIFNLDRDIKLNLKAKVGERVDLDINWDGSETFNVESKKLKMAYRGGQDNIIKTIEAGNVSMTTSNSLIDGGAALFGIKADLQFGNLGLNLLFSQQESLSQTVTTEGGVSKRAFNISADSYDERQHFFLGHWFAETYDKALSNLPYIESQITITRIEVWVTNRRGEYEEVRNIVAFADLGEHNKIYNHLWRAEGVSDLPANSANNIYSELLTNYASARKIGSTANILPGEMQQGLDWEKLESARLLNSNDYSYQPQLGYISLRRPLRDDELLAVAFEYLYAGKVYQVGEFAADITNRAGNRNEGEEIETGSNDNANNEALYLKLLKPISLSPRSPTWPLMMKNIYSLGYDIGKLQKDGFKLDITYRSDTTGVEMSYLPEAGSGGDLLLKMMNLDRLNDRDDPYPDGEFDYLEGVTIDSDKGYIIFPVREPFGSHLRQKIGNDAVADRYIFQELYDSTVTVARQIPERNRFSISGEYSGSSRSEIDLRVNNIERGSVTITAAGVTLTEGVDYQVDYMMGRVTILNQSIIESRRELNIRLENRPLMQTARKGLMGANLQYDISKHLSVGGTLLHFYEKSMMVKTPFGDESPRNTLWGANLLYDKENLLVTNIIDKLPFINATEPSRLTTNLNFAQMLPGHYKNRYGGGYSYLDDFETSTSTINISSPHLWSLASTPCDRSSEGLFPEATLSNNIDYGKNRALIAWFNIDAIFTRKNSALTPKHILNDADQLSDHRVREIYESEIYPDRESYYGLPATLQVLNISFYPNERGPYNLDRELDSDGKLLNPEKRWGGIMRPMELRDFEAANIEYIEFWLMDPFINDSTGDAAGGDLYFNLGDISEDILKDGKRFFENGLPTDNDPEAVGQTVWGKYPKRESTLYAFDDSRGSEARKIQDVGLNGLSSEEEKIYPAYADYLQYLKEQLPSTTIEQMESDPHSPLNDPAGDNFNHYRGKEQDREELSILDRYRYWNGTEGNSTAEEMDDYMTVARTTPDREDINGDNTMNENEGYWQYRVSLRPESMQVGQNHIVEKRETTVRLRNGSESRVSWYQFRIPISEYQKKVGNINGFSNIRFIRMFMTNFKKPQFLRFASLELVQSEWRVCESSLDPDGKSSVTGEIDISVVNIEENSGRSPVNYIMPPGVTRVIDPGQPQLRQENEQSLSLRITNLSEGDSRAIQKNVNYDMRRYKRLQMFVHAEALSDRAAILNDGDLSVFLRLGSDFNNNYYEYEIPLKVTPEGRYSALSSSDREQVWPTENMFDFQLELLTSLKSERNSKELSEQTNIRHSYFSRNDPERLDNLLSIMGNPSLADVRVMMIGIRNRSDNSRSAEIWVNELRLCEFDEEGGWAAEANINLTLSDIGNITFSGRRETTGFGAVDQKLQQRRDNDLNSFNLTVNMELGRLLPQEAKVTAPFYYSHESRATQPLYDPFNQDLLLSESLMRISDPQLRDSTKALSETIQSNSSIGLTNLKVDLRSSRPMPYDPANFSFSFSHNRSSGRSPETELSTVKDWRLFAGYEYAPRLELWKPFSSVGDSISQRSGAIKFMQSIAINPLPNLISLSSEIIRNYRELQLRDLESYLYDGVAATGQQAVESSQQRYLTRSQNFYWDRKFTLNWEVTRKIKLSFSSGTTAEIEEPYLQVNREINPDDYQLWRDSVMHSIVNLGRPLNYEQRADISLKLPLEHFKTLNWISSEASYGSRYRWERGADIADRNIGNTLYNDMTLNLNGRFNFVTLYNKVPILHRANARPTDRSSYNSAFNSTSLYGGSRSGNLSQQLLRAAMMLRSININISHKNSNVLPGYNVMSGDIFGQKNLSGHLRPGLGFAFGFDGGEQFIERSLANNLLLTNEENINPALSNTTLTLRLEALFEPLPGISINLNMIYEDNQRSELYYMMDGMPVIQGGSFAISSMSLRSAFEQPKATNSYRSSSFDKFLNYHDIIARRIEYIYNGGGPSTEAGALNGSSQGLNSPTPGLSNAVGDGININSADLLIPAFIAAYSGSDPKTIELTPFPSISTMLPNWDISCNLVTLIPALHNSVKQLRLNHRYLSQYRVGSYSSLVGLTKLTDDNQGWGYSVNSVTGAITYSSPFDISSVNIVESFNPLLGLESLLLNNIDFSIRFNRSRSLSLNIASQRIVEVRDNDIGMGVGYRLEKFNRLLKLKSSSESGIVFRCDIAYKDSRALVRKIEDGFSQATGGLQTTTIRFTADWEISSRLTLRGFYDRMAQRPLVSSTSYPGANSNGGVTLRLNLSQ